MTVLRRSLLLAFIWFGLAFCFAVDVWLSRFGVGAQLVFAPFLFAAAFGALAATYAVWHD